MQLARLVGVAQAALPSVGSLDPAEHVIEGAVFHHYHHDVLDARLIRRRKLRLPERRPRGADMHGSERTARHRGFSQGTASSNAWSRESTAMDAATVAHV